MNLDLDKNIVIEYINRYEKLYWTCIKNDSKQFW